MKNKKMTHTTIVILIIIAIVIITIVSIIIWALSILFSSNKNHTASSIENITAPVQLGDTNATYNPTVGTYSSANYRVVVSNGLKFTIDASKLIPTVLKTGETFKVFQTDCGTSDVNLSILINVSDNSYEKEMKSPENLVSKYTANGGTIIQSIQETTVNNRKCAYFTVNISGMPYLIAYTAGNKEKKIGMECQIDDSRISEALDMFTEISNSVVSTNEPNTTFEEQQLPGAKKETSTLILHGKTIDFKVPQGLYSTSNLVLENSALEYFTQKDSCINVTANIEYTSYDIEAPEEYLNALKSASTSRENFSASEIKTLKTNGREITYFSYEYTINESKLSYLYAVCNMSNNFRFTVSASAINSDFDKLTIDLIKDFFNITEK